MYGHCVANFRDDDLSRMYLWLRDDDERTTLRHIVPAYNGTVTDAGNRTPTYAQMGACPPGTYRIGQPRENMPDDPEFASEGAFFTELIDVSGLWVPNGRSEIGIHGGRPELWPAITEGCTRLRDEDNNNIFVPFVRYIQQHGGNVEYTVIR